MPTGIITAANQSFVGGFSAPRFAFTVDLDAPAAESLFGKNITLDGIAVKVVDVRGCSLDLVSKPSQERGADGLSPSHKFKELVPGSKVAVEF